MKQKSQEDETKLIVNLVNFVSKHKVSIQNPAQFNLFSKKLKDIFELEISLMNKKYDQNANESDNDINFYFYGLPDESKLGSFDFSLNKKIIINTNTRYFNMLDSDDSNERINGCREILKVLFHEIRHYIQYQIVTDKVNSVDNYHYLKEFVLREFSNIDDSRNTYNDNHDSFAIEADADIAADMRSINYFNLDSLKDQISIYEATKNMSNLEITNVYGAKIVVDREAYINSFVDKLITKNKKLYLLDKYPLLNCEYNNDGTKKDFLTLYNDMNNSIEDINSFNIEDENKTILINDIKEVYYDLFEKQLREDTKEAIKIMFYEIGENNVKKLLNDMNLSFISQAKSSAYKTCKKYDACLKKKIMYNLPHIDPNYGVIQVKDKKNTYCVDVNDYINELEFDNLDGRSKKIVTSNMVKNRIPRCGYFILRDNNIKISIEDFFKQFVIPSAYEFNSVEKYEDFLKNTVLSSEEMNRRIDLENINKKCQIRKVFLNHISSTYFDKSIVKIHGYKLKNIKDQNNQSEYLQYALSIIKAYEHNFENFSIIFPGLIPNVDFDKNDSNRFIYSYSKEQIKLFENICFYAKKISGDTVLNSSGIDYYNEFINSPIFKTIVNYMGINIYNEKEKGL